MTTMRDIVTAAYRRLNLVAIDDTPTAEQAQDGLETLNEMLFAWKNDGVDITHTVKVLVDTFPLGDEFVGGVKSMLAVALAERNGDEVTPQLAATAQNCWNALQAAYIEAPAAAFDDALVFMPSLGSISYTRTV